MESNNIKELPEILELDGLINHYVQSNRAGLFSYKIIQESFWKAIEAVQKTATPIKDNVSDGWIKTEDRLPNNITPVIVAANFDKYIITCPDTAYYKDGKWFDNSNDIQLFDNFITHWQSLPSPPTHPKK